MTDQITSKKITLENLIKEIIEARGKKNKEVAFGLGLNEKTFDGILNRTGAIKADLLFRLSDYLGFDLEWIKTSLGYSGMDVQPFSEGIPRMPEKLREKELAELYGYMDSMIAQNSEEIGYIADQIFGYCSQNEFYLLDLLLPEGEEIALMNTSRKKHFCCISKTKPIEGQMRRMSSRPQILTVREVIMRTIDERMRKK